MDTIEFTPYHPNRRVSAFVGGAAGLLLGIGATTIVVTATGGEQTDPLAAASMPASDVAANRTAVAHRQLRSADCRYLADVRRVRQGKLPWSADAASEWLSQGHGNGQR
jgi:hypothetical protein